jgi:hypothetical protein
MNSLHPTGGLALPSLYGPGALIPRIELQESVSLPSVTTKISGGYVWVCGVLEPKRISGLYKGANENLVTLKEVIQQDENLEKKLALFFTGPDSHGVLGDVAGPFRGTWLTTIMSS